MSGISAAIRSAASKVVIRHAGYEGTHGSVLFVGSERRAPSLAPFFCGDDAVPTGEGMTRRSAAAPRIVDTATAGGVAVLRPSQDDTPLEAAMPPGTIVPLLVELNRDLPADLDQLRSEIRTSTTSEDLRRIRRAGFTYRTTSDPTVLRDFHTRFYSPLVATRFPDDGLVRPLPNMLRDLERGGELICADIDGEWVAGIFNVATDHKYELHSLGIRDADEDIRQKRAVAALIVRSLERGVELGKPSASLGRSLPFLGKGPVWFKAKWGATLSRVHGPGKVVVFLDLRHAPIRRLLSEHPIIHRLGDGELGVVAWLDPGEEPLRVVEREARRYPGIMRWFILGEAETLTTAADTLIQNERVTLVPVPPSGADPIWLGSLLARAE